MAREMPAVLVLGCDRPTYVHVVLASVFNNQFVDKFPVYVAVDGKDKQAGMLESIGHFPVAGYLFRDRIGGGQHFMHSIQAIMDYGHRYVFFIEEDVLIRPDTLAWILNSPFESLLSDYILIAFSFAGASRSVNHYRGFASLACADTFREIFDFAVKKQYVGLIRPWHHDLPAHERIAEDGLFNCFVRPKGLRLWTAGRHYCGHFGFIGSHHKKPQLTEEELRLEEELFSGPREGWLPNAISLFRPEITDKYRRIRPKDFVYE